MRTTVTLEPDVAAAVDRLRREQSVGLSAAVNELARAGLVRARERKAFVQTTSDMGMKVDVRNVGEVLDLLDGR